MEENELTELYFSRDESAIACTESRYGGLLKRLVMGILRCEQDCEECLSDVYFRLWSTIPPVRPDSFKAYALKIARTEALMKLRRQRAKKRDRALERSLNELEGILPDKSVPDGSQGEITELINSFLGGLGRDARVIFVKKYWFFESVREISQSCGFSEAKVKSSLHSTREKLKKYLEQEGVVL